MSVSICLSINSLRFSIRLFILLVNSLSIILDAQVEDSGVYLCAVPQMNLTERIEVSIISK